MKTITKYPQQDLCTLKDDLKGLSWDDFHCSYPQVYAKCVQQAISEQNGECAYTEIPLPDKSQHLDHYKKKAIFPELTFDWNILLTVFAKSCFSSLVKCFAEILDLKNRLL